MITFKDIVKLGIGTRFVMKQELCNIFEDIPKSVRYSVRYDEYICADISPDKSLIKINSEWLPVEHIPYFSEIIFIIKDKPIRKK